MFIASILTPLFIDDASVSYAQEFKWNVESPGTTVGLRGLSAGADGSLWVGGKGMVHVSRENGRTGTWKSIAVPGFEGLEFRSIHAWDANRVCIATAGTPAVVLLTEDGGSHWSETYRHPSAQAFFDALVFDLADNQKGYAVSDPVEGQWLVIETINGGKNWKTLPNTPKSLDKEGAFAASNGSLALLKDQLWLGTGGATPSPLENILQYDGKQWQRRSSSIASKESAGIFAIHFNSPTSGVAMGGDYRQEADASTGSSWTSDGGTTWHSSIKHPSGFRSSVCSVQKNGATVLYAVGPNGTDRSTDGKNWERISEVGFHAIRALPDGTLIAAGSGGRFGWCRTNE